MPIAEKRSVFPVSVEELFDWHARPGALQRLTPPWEDVKVLASTGGIQVGAQIDLAMRIGPLPVRWRAFHDGYEEDRWFRDIQVRGPFACWVHDHRFEAVPEGAALTDHVEYELPLAPLGTWFGGRIARTTLERTFRYRHALLRLDLLRHSQFRSKGSRRFVVSEPAGEIGAALCAFLGTGGHTVERISNDLRSAGNPEAFTLAALEGADVVIHLSSSNSEAEVEYMRTLSTTLSRMGRKPEALIVVGDASVYGDRGDEVLDEASAPGSGRVAGLAVAREAATAPAVAAGIRTVLLRTGAVLTPAGGILRRLLPWFRAGLGFRLGGGGRQMSSVSLEDLLGVIQFSAFTGTLSGPVNVATPEWVSNREFAATLGRVLSRPSAVPLPCWKAPLVLGTRNAELLMSSRAVVPQALQKAGFRFQLPALEEALRFELGC